MPEIVDFVKGIPTEELPDLLEGQFESIAHKNSEHGSLGQFKKVLPISEELCVACVAKENASQLKAEAEMLQLMKKLDLPAVNCYGELFNISEGSKALIMEFVSNAVLLDSKFPLHINRIMLPMLMGLQIPTGKERWMDDFYPVLEKMEIQLNSNSLNAEDIKAKAQNIAQQVHKLIENLQKKHNMYW